MHDLVFDLQYAIRILRQNPGFAAVAIITLALGIGGTTAMFSVLDPVLFRPLAYREPERLVSITTFWPSTGFEFLTSAEYAEFGRESRIFEGLAAYPHGLDTMKLTTADAWQRVVVTRITPSLFPVLGVQPVRGRSFQPEESRPVPPNVAILTHGLWMRAFGGDPAVIGRPITLDQQAYTVIGIMPASFRFPEEEKVDIFTPLPTGDARMQHGPEMRLWRCIGRLKPGVAVEQAKADLAGIFERIRAQYKWLYRNDVQLRVVPLRLHQVKEVRSGLMVLGAAVGFVLLIACVNVAHILMARAVARAREIAVRTALGARRMRLVRQLLTESALVGVLGGVLGSVIAFAGLKASLHALPADIPHIDQVTVNLRVLAFTAAVALAAGLLFGLAPVSTALRTNLIETLKLGANPAPGSPRRWLRGGLLVAEIAFSMLLLAGAALFMKSLWRLQNVSLGFYPEHVVAAAIPLQDTAHASGPPQRQFLRNAMERAIRLPGVTAVAVADTLPPGNSGLQGFSRQDRPLPEPGHRGDNMLLRSVSEDYFRAMGIPLVRGRAFTAGDRAESLAVVVVNQTLARRYFPNEDPLGKRIGGLYPDFHWTTIVGVVGDEKNDGLQGAPQPQAYSPLAQHETLNDAWLVVRTAGEPRAAAAAIRSELRGLDKTIPVTVQPMPDQIAELLARPRFQAGVMAIFSVLALLMAAAGVYGVAFLGRGAANAGNRRAHGAGRYTCRCPAARSWRRPHARWPGLDHGNCRSARCGPVHRSAALRGNPDGHANVCGCGVRASVCRLSPLLTFPPGAPLARIRP